ncbi:RDD family protein [bacterium]|nr:RDD family protein [bacterium]
MEDVRTYQLADIGERFVALAVDSLIVGIAGGLFGANGNWWGAGIVAFMVGALYQWYFLTQQDGQTLGKKLMGLRVIKVDGMPIRDADAVLRFIGYYINSFLLGLGWLWAFVDSNHQGLHDKIANTYVVKASSVRSSSSVVVGEKTKNM